MRILIYGINFDPEVSGVGRCTGMLATGLSDHGFEVDVITTHPHYPAWKFSDGLLRFRLQFAKIGGGSVIRCPTIFAPHSRRWKRVLFLCGFAITSGIALALQIVIRRPNLIFVIVPTFFCTPISVALAKAFNVKIWCHFQDFELDLAFSNHKIFGENQTLQKFAKKMESILLR